MPDDAPYGTVETLPNLAAGARLSFHAVSTLTKVAGATVAALRRTDDPAHVATARGARDVINGPVT